jgi:hypothetical protein
VNDELRAKRERDAAYKALAALNKREYDQLRSWWLGVRLRNNYTGRTGVATKVQTYTRDGVCQVLILIGGRWFLGDAWGLAS